VTLLDIDKEADRLIGQSGGTASFKTVPGYRWATCLCVNDVVVHGIPTSYVLKDGDILTIDIGLVYGGFHTDTAWTKMVGKDDSAAGEKKKAFLAVGQEALEKAIALARVGNHVGDISASTQNILLKAKYGIVKTLVGHGVGHELHEDPQVPNYVRGARENTYKFQGGETIAIEPIYVMGEGQIVYDNDDGWTLATKDHSLAAVFEHSVAITQDGPIVLTKAQN
jgi:methionyl aminopeptidase